MITKTFLRSFFSIAIFFFISSCSHKLYSIPTGCVKDEFTIKFIDQELSLKPNQFFNVADLNLTENYWSKASRLATKPNGFNFGNIQSYKISIVHNSTTYYGRIAFFKVPYRCKNDAVASFYKIYIPDSYFQKANNGAQSCFFEYTNVNPKIGITSPTWIIWLSDSPVF